MDGGWLEPSFLLLEKELTGKQEGKALVNPGGVWISESSA